MLNELSDEELVARFQAGDIEAITALHGRHHLPLRSHSRNRGLPDDDASSLASVVLIEAATRFDASRTSRFKTLLWLTWGRRMQDEFRKGPGGLRGFRTTDGFDVEAMQEARRRLSGDAQADDVSGGTDPADSVASDGWIAWASSEIEKSLPSGPTGIRRLAVWNQTLRRAAGLPFLSDGDIADKFSCDKSTVSRDHSFLEARFRELLAEERDQDDSQPDDSDTLDRPKEEPDDPDSL